MAKKDTQYDNVISSLFEGMDGVLSTKTVVGEPTQLGDTIIVPLVDVSFGVGASAGNNSTKGSESGVGGMGGKMSPSAVLVIHNGSTKLISVKNQDTVTKVIERIPDLVDKFWKPKKKEDEISDEEAVEAAFPEEDL